MASARPRWLRITLRIVIGVVVAIAVIVAALAVSIPIAGIGSAGRIASVSNTTIPGVAGGPDVEAYVAAPNAPGPVPVVIMVHEFWGLNQGITEKADLLAEQGYVVVAPDVFRGSTTSWIPRAIWQVSTTPAEQVNADLDSVYAWLGEQPDVDPDRIAIVGFCFGGRTAMLYSLHNPTLRGTTVFYGNPPLDAERLRALRGPVLGIFGGADQSIPLEDVDAFRTALVDAGVESTVTVYPDQPHAFVDSVESIQAGGPQGEAWNEMVDFLEGAFAADEQGSTSAEPQVADDPFGWRYLFRLAFSHVGSGPHSH